MAETASLDVPREQLEQFAAQLSHESRAVLLEAAYKAEFDPDMIEELSLEELNIGQLESGMKPRFICPHVGCESVFDPTLLRQVSFFRRIEKPYNVRHGDPQKGDGILYFPNDHEVPWGQYRVRGFRCPECNRPVNVPPKWEVTD